jgi:hypothetical protein
MESVLYLNSGGVYMGKIAVKNYTMSDTIKEVTRNTKGNL